MKQHAIRLILAVQFLTRLPTPQVRNFSANLLTEAAIWFPLVGLLIGALLWLTGNLIHVMDPWLVALLVTSLWIGVTGALHLDGLADLADALGAAHRDPERLMAVMKDPHLGSFGVLALLQQVLAKLILCRLLLSSPGLPALILIPAWARWGVLYWSHCLPPLAPGLADAFRWHLRPLHYWAWLLPLTGLSIWLAPALLLAPALVWIWRCYLHHKLGGVSGDCLGAGIERVETGLLLAMVIMPLLQQNLPI